MGHRAQWESLMSKYSRSTLTWYSFVGRQVTQSNPTCYNVIKAPFRGWPWREVLHVAGGLGSWEISPPRSGPRPSGCNVKWATSTRTCSPPVLRLDHASPTDATPKLGPSSLAVTEQHYQSRKWLVLLHRHAIRGRQQRTEWLPRPWGCLS